MATKYAFAQGLRELRFHLSNSGQGSDACRQGYHTKNVGAVTDNCDQIIPETSISYDEASQPKHTHPNTRSFGC
jgi:hypothetical protein